MRLWLRNRCCAVSLTVGGMALLTPGIARACSVCVGSSPVDYGYFWAVLLLMAMPFAVSGSIGGWIFYTYRRARSRGVTNAAAWQSGAGGHADGSPLTFGRNDAKVPLLERQEESGN